MKNQLGTVGIVGISFLLLLCASCTPLIGAYSPEAYKNATELKAETLALMEKATEPYEEHEGSVERLKVELQKAYEYVRGVPRNGMAADQWALLTDEDGDLLGRFFKRWEENEGQPLSPTFVREFVDIVRDAFDEIICLEANKKEAQTCETASGE